MKRATLLVPFLAVALALPLFAQQAERDVKTGGTGKEETLKLMINGGIDVAFAYEGSEIRETSRWFNGGLDSGNVSRDPNYFFNGPVWISFWASLQDNVEMNVTLRTMPYSDQNSVQANGGTDATTNRLNWGDDALFTGTTGVVVKYAYMRVKEFFTPALSMTVGQMDVIWDVRGRGNAIFLDAAHAESPWGEIDRAWATTVRTEEAPVGFKFNYTMDSLSLELGLFPVVHEASTLGLGVTNGSNQQAIYYVNMIYNLGDSGRIGAIFADFHGIRPEDNVYTFGLSAVFTFGGNFELFFEGYTQFGQAWSLGNHTPLSGAAKLEEGDHIAHSFLLGARLDVPGDVAMMFELHILYATGHDQDNGAEFSTADGFGTGGLTNDNSAEFMSYENYDVMIILNSNEWGYDFDNNILQITLQAGVMLSTGAPMKNNLHLTLKLAYANAMETWEAAAVGARPAESEDVLGFEVDFTVRYYMNKNASLYWSVAYLAGSDVISLFSREANDYAWMTLLGVQVSH